MLKMPCNFMSPISIVFLLSIAMTQLANASDDLWDVLKEGGKVVLIRHAPVERGAENGDPLLRDPSCKSERNLSTEGKRNAALVGARFEEHQVPVSKVLHSPFCRTADTARIAFGEATSADYLSLLEILPPEKASLHTDELSQVIDTYAGDGNLVLVTHEPNISAVAFELLRHLDLLVIDPKGEAEFEELGVIRFSESE